MCDVFVLFVSLWWKDARDSTIVYRSSDRTNSSIFSKASAMERTFHSSGW